MLVLTFLVPLSVGAVLFNPTYKRIVLAIGLSVLIPLLSYPSLMIFFFILVRSSLDLTAGIDLYGNLNLASIITLLFIFITLPFVLDRSSLSYIHRDQFLRRFNKIFLLLLFLAALSLTNTQDVVTSAGDIFRLISILLIFNYTYLHFSGDVRLRSLVMIILASSFASLVLGITQHILETGNPDTPGFNRIYGTFLHPNAFAQYLLVVFWAALYLLGKWQTNKWVQAGIWFFVTFVLVEIYLTYTRGVWIALILSMMVYGFSLTKVTSKVLFFAVTASVLAIGYESFQGRFLDLLYPDIVPMNSLQWRLITWEASFFAISTHPLLGHGLGMYEKNFLFMAHNDFLRFAYEIGIPGLLCYLLLLGYLIYSAATGKRPFPSLRPTRESNCCICLLLSLLLVSSADNLARSNVVIFYMFALLGALFGSIRRRSDS